MSRRASRRASRATHAHQVTVRKPARSRSLRPDEDPRRALIKQRLREWGKWRRSMHVGPARVESWWGKVILDRFLPQGRRDAEIVIDEPRVHATDAHIAALDPLLRPVLLHQYVVGAHLTKHEKARACGLSSYQRYYEILERAHDAFEIRAYVVEVVRPSKPELVDVATCEPDGD
jgi:hypothetical protein